MQTSKYAFSYFNLLHMWIGSHERLIVNSKLPLMMFIFLYLIIGHDAAFAKKYFTKTDNLGNICDYTSQSRCGDVCIDNIRKCKCGDQVFSIKYGAAQHCCVPPSTTAQCHLDPYKNGKCQGGTTLNRTQQCNDQCYNQYSQKANTSSLSISSMYRCDNGDCVPAWSMCRGYSMCGDKSDLRACNPELTCVAYNDSTVSTITSDLVDGHSFCVQINERNDGTYDAVTREDEDNLDIVSTSASLNYTKLGHCNDSYDPGVKCGSRCMPTYGWCKLGISDQCDDGDQSITTNNPQLCQNKTFWSKVSCNVHYPNSGNYDATVVGDIASYGKRCSGSKQHCIYPWYTTHNKYYEAGLQNSWMKTCNLIRT